MKRELEEKFPYLCLVRDEILEWQKELDISPTMYYYITWGLHYLVQLILTHLNKCKTLQRGDLTLLFTSIVHYGHVLIAVVDGYVFLVIILAYSSDHFS